MLLKLLKKHSIYINDGIYDFVNDRDQGNR